MDVSLPSVSTLDAEDLNHDGSDGFDTQEDLDEAVKAALDDSDADVRLPRSIAAGTDLFQSSAYKPRGLPSLEDRSAVDERDIDAAPKRDVRVEKPLKRKFFDEQTKRLSPFDPSSVEAVAVDANGPEHASQPPSDEDPLGMDAALDAPTANDDDALDRLLAKVREERAHNGGLPNPGAESLDLDSLPMRDDVITSELLVMNKERQRPAAETPDNPLLEALDDASASDLQTFERDSDDATDIREAALLASDSGEPSAEENPIKHGARLPFASMLAESLSLQPVVSPSHPTERLPPEFSLAEVDRLGKLKNKRTKARSEDQQPAPRTPELLEPVTGASDDILPVTVGTPTCHWRLDANGQPQLASIRLDATSSPVPIEEFAQRVESGSLRLDALGMDEDDFAPIREATGTYRAIRPDDVDLPSQEAVGAAPAPFDFSAAPAIVDERVMDAEEFEDESDISFVPDSARDADLDPEDLDNSVLADVSLTGMSLVELPVPPQRTKSGRVDVDRVAIEFDTMSPELAHTSPPPIEALEEDEFADDSLLDVSLSSLSLPDVSLPSFPSTAGIGFSAAELSQGKSLGEQYADQVLPRASQSFDDADAQTAAGGFGAKGDTADDSSVSTQELAMPSAASSSIRPNVRPNVRQNVRPKAAPAMRRRMPQPPAAQEEAGGLTTIPLRESVAHLRALQTAAPRSRQPLSQLKVEGTPVTEAARLESAVPVATRAVRPQMIPPRVARPKETGSEGDRLRKGHDLYLLAMEKLEAGRTSEALLNSKLAAAYDPENQGYRQLTAFITEQSRHNRPAPRAHL